VTALSSVEDETKSWRVDLCAAKRAFSLIISYACDCSKLEPNTRRKELIMTTKHTSRKQWISYAMCLGLLLGAAIPSLAQNNTSATSASEDKQKAAKAEWLNAEKKLVDIINKEVQILTKEKNGAAKEWPAIHGSLMERLFQSSTALGAQGKLEGEWPAAQRAMLQHAHSELSKLSRRSHGRDRDKGARRLLKAEEKLIDRTLGTLPAPMESAGQTRQAALIAQAKAHGHTPYRYKGHRGRRSICPRSIGQKPLFPCEQCDGATKVNAQ
jgi:hypothetical protein